MLAEVEVELVLISNTELWLEQLFYLKEQCQRLFVGIGEKKAIVAIGRELLAAVWHKFIEQTAALHPDPQIVIPNMMIWQREKSKATQQGK